MGGWYSRDILRHIGANSVNDVGWPLKSPFLLVISRKITFSRDRVIYKLARCIIWTYIHSYLSFMRTGISPMPTRICSLALYLFFILLVEGARMRYILGHFITSWPLYLHKELFHGDIFLQNITHVGGLLSQFNRTCSYPTTSTMMVMGASGGWRRFKGILLKRHLHLFFDLHLHC